MDIDNIWIALQKSNNKFEDQIEFFKTNYNKIFMTMGDKVNCIIHVYVHVHVCICKCICICTCTCTCTCICIETLQTF